MRNKKIFPLLLAAVALSVAACSSSNSRGEAAPELLGIDSLPPDIQNLVRAVAKNDTLSFAAAVSYPLQRPYPLRDIATDSAMRTYYGVLMDDSLRNVIIDNPGKSWVDCGWRGWSAGDGNYIWFDGGIYAIPYMSKRETAMRDSLVRVEMASLYKPMRRGWQPVACYRGVGNDSVFRIDMRQPANKAPQFRLAAYASPAGLRNRPAAESRALFEQMTAGAFEEGAMVLRAKIDMASPNLNMRDPVIYRILKAHHHRTGDKWCVYPMYDFAHPLSDAREGVTHSLCSLEFENHRPLYDWVLRAADIEQPPRQIEFARMNVNYTLTSKRKCLKLVNDGLVSGWDDPRMATLCGMRRRGYPAEAVRAFVEKIGVSKAYSVIDYALLESCVRDRLNQEADRAMAVLRPLKIVIDNYPENRQEQIEVEINPNRPERGKKTVSFSRELYIEQDDFMLDPPGKYFRLCPQKEVRLKGAYYIRYASHETDADGKITVVHCTYDPESRGGETPDGRKVKGTLHWVNALDCAEATVRLYERLFNVENPSDEEGVSSFAENLNPCSLEELSGCKISAELATAAVGDTFQFLRQGYFCADPDSTPGHPVFNRTVALKDSFVKK